LRAVGGGVIHESNLRKAGGSGGEVFKPSPVRAYQFAAIEKPAFNFNALDGDLAIVRHRHRLFYKRAGQFFGVANPTYAQRQIIAVICGVRCARDKQHRNKS
jgi:hypothetical protein